QSQYGRDPLALRPAVTGGLPFSRVLPANQAKKMPSCNHRHINRSQGDLGQLLYCFLQLRMHNTAQKLPNLEDGVLFHQTSMIWSRRVPTLTYRMGAPARSWSRSTYALAAGGSSARRRTSLRPF